MEEVNINQFKQFVNSFFSMYPEKGETELLIRVDLDSNLNFREFAKWREDDTCRDYLY